MDEYIPSSASGQPEKTGTVSLGSAVADRDASASLPCLLSNNGIKDDSEKVKLSSYQKRAVHTFFENVSVFIDLIGIDRCGFLTLTFPDNISCHKEAYERLRSFRTSFLRRHSFYGEWVCVKERQKRGAWHYHLLIDCGADIRSGVYWKQVSRANLSGFYYQSCNIPAHLKELRKELLEVLPKYGFGRHELQPVRTSKEQVARYLAKYLSKGFKERRPDDKRVKLVTYSSKWLRSSPKFQWVNENSAKWRHQVRFFCHAHGFNDLDHLSEFCGSRWAYMLTDYIIESDWEDIFHAERPNFLQLRQILRSYLASRGVEFDEKKTTSDLVESLDGLDDVSDFNPYTPVILDQVESARKEMIELKRSLRSPSSFVSELQPCIVCGKLAPFADQSSSWDGGCCCRDSACVVVDHAEDLLTRVTHLYSRVPGSLFSVGISSGAVWIVGDNNWCSCLISFDGDFLFSVKRYLEERYSGVLDSLVFDNYGDSFYVSGAVVSVFQIYMDLFGNTEYLNKQLVPF